MLRGKPNGSAGEMEITMTPLTRWGAGVLGVLIASGVISSILMFAEQKVTSWRIERVEHDVAKIKSTVDDIEGKVDDIEDRVTRNHP